MHVPNIKNSRLGSFREEDV